MSTWLDLPNPIWNDPDLWPTDDYAIERAHTDALNRIDQEYGCDAIVNVAFDHPQCLEIMEYCGLPEYDPFSNRCWDHTPGNLTSGHM